jgi:hypothetical protein
MTNSPTRNAVYGALFNLTAPLDASVGGPFVSRRRKFVNPAGLSPEAFPSFFQTEHKDTTVQSRSGMPYTRHFKATWGVWFFSDCTDPTVWPTIAMNNYQDMLENALSDFAQPDETQRFGFLIERAFIDGESIRVPGDEDGMGLLMIPISMVVPGISSLI